MVQAAVCAEDRAVGADDFAGAIVDVLAQEGVDVDLAEEADALAVFFLGVGQAASSGNFADLGFGDVADGEVGALELLLADEGEKVTLVLVLVAAFEEAGGAFGCVFEPAVVTGGHAVKALAQRVVEEDAKLHLAIAHDVGIGRGPATIAGHQVVHHALAVIADEVDDLEVDAEVPGDGFGVGDVLLPGTVGKNVAAFLVHPGAHVSAGDVVSGVFEAQCGHGAIDAAGKRHEEFFGMVSHGEAAHPPGQMVPRG